MSNLAGDSGNVVAGPLGVTPVDVPPIVARGGRRRLRLPAWFLVLLRNPRSAFGLGLFSLIVIVSLAAPLLTSHKPNDAGELIRQSPSLRYPMGTTDQGYNVYSQVVYGGRLTLMVSITATLMAMAIAITLGLLAAYSAGWIDELINTISNIFIVIPLLPLVIVISALVQQTGPWIMALTIGLTSWALPTRVLRSQALTLRNRDFILAAKVSGESTPRIIAGELIPNMLSQIAANAMIIFWLSVLTEAALEFLGFGSATAYSWGTILFWAQNNSALAQGEWWHILFPGFAIVLTIMSIVFVNFGIDEISNPRLQKEKRRRRPKVATATPVPAAEGGVE
ncbi:MAG: ABC transporter permease [Gaiellaceae bacterium]